MWTRSFACVVLLGGALAGQSKKYGVGRPPTPAEIKAWDVSVAPDGKELPPGQGNSTKGREIYGLRCQRCHGEAGKGGDEAALVGGKGSLNTPKPLKTVGSYWPYATTLFDYVRRSMPYKDPGTLTDSQVYSVTAYILELNGIISSGAVMDARTLPQVKMPNRDGFIPDPRPRDLKKARP